MATSGVINGTLYSAQFVDAFAGTAVDVDLQTECSISLALETRDITTKSSSGFREITGGLRTGTITFSAIQDFSKTTNLDTLAATWADSTNRGECTVAFASSEAADAKFSANAILTSLEVSAGVEDNLTYSGTFELTGAITFAASS